MIKKSPLKKISEKEAQIKRQYQKICRDIDKKLLDESGIIPCQSCGIRVAKGTYGIIYSNRSWGHSHNLSVGQYKEFELDPHNIAPRCQNSMGREGCHEKLDSGDIKKIMSLKDFEELLEYRKTICPEAYNLWITKMHEIGIYKYEYV